MGYPHEESPFALEVRRELERARGQALRLVAVGEEVPGAEEVPGVTPGGKRLVRLPGHPPLASLHEAYSVILEELDELWEHVRKRRQDRVPAETLKELVQIAAMCQRAAEDLGLVKEA